MSSPSTFIDALQERSREWIRVLSQPNPAYKPQTTVRAYTYDTVDVRGDNDLDWRSSSRSAEDKTPAWLLRLQRRSAITRTIIFVLSSEWSFLTVLGFLSAALFLTTEIAVDNILGGRLWILSALPNLSFLRLIVWTLYSLFFSIIARFCVEYISPFAAGSGIPEMKSILSGLKLKGYLSFDNLIAKIVGNVVAYCSDLSIGREGPYIMICGILANVLLKLDIFYRIRSDNSSKFQMLSAACAGGIATVFGSPVGGVLFSIEVTSTYYLIQNLTKSFLCAFCAAFFTSYIGNHGLLTPFVTHFDSKTFSNGKILSFIMLGVVCGVLGAFFVVAQDYVSKMRKKYFWLSKDRYKQVCIISIISSIFTYASFMPLHEGQFYTIRSMFSDTKLTEWERPSVYFNLIYFIIFKFFLTVVSIGLPVPCGLFVPVFVMGSAIGRLWGEVLSDLFPDMLITPGGFAVVGAAAMSAGTTRALSTCVIIFELTGQLVYMFPVLISVIVATAVGNLLSPSVYDKILESKGLPFLPPLGHRALRKSGRDVMNNSIHCVSRETTYKDLSLLLKRSSFQYFPVIDHPGNMLLIGEIDRSYLRKILDDRERDYLSQSGNRQRLVDVMNHYDKGLPASPDMGSDVTGSPMEEFFSTRALIELQRPHFDPSPFQLVDKTPLTKIHFMFSMLGITHVWCTHKAKLAGLITRKEFMKKCWELNEQRNATED
ncbi:chloride channel protein 2-like [Planoprotostelium fungivorum]|uniref:Chloride channel protein n=1 Tax=Planoprotostelium fungivorum TaxID=1890364 RepID=A0A2P6N753_9EUKA|nr:chloride channel protein 2-like [Planoprotostelium fungivorum]